MLRAVNFAIMITRLGLTGRAITVCVLLVLGAVGTISAVLIRQNQADSIRRMTDHATSQARTISRSIAHAAMLDDKEGLRRILRAAGSDPALQAVCIRGAPGHKTSRVEYKRDENFESELEPDPEVANPMGGPFMRGDVRVELSHDELLVVAPVWPDFTEIDLSDIEDGDAESRHGALSDSPIGFVCLVYSFAQVHAELANRVRSSIAIASIVVAIGIGLTVVMVRKLLRPVRDLVVTTSAIATGNLAERVPAQAIGEIGVLARAFNHMADRLQETYASIERKVEERTAELRAEVAERKRTEGELLREKRFSDQTIDSTPGVFYLFDDQGRLMRWNRNFERISGCSAEEISRMHLLDIIPQHDKERVAEAIREVFARGESAVEAGFLSKDGSETPHFFTGKRITLDHKSCLVGMGIDITERKRAEDQLREHAAALENTNKALESANIAAEAANRAKSEFLANMSHEIRTPMNGIMGMTELALATDLTDEQREYLTAAAECSNALLVLLNDILDLSKIEAGKMALETIAFDPVETVCSAVSFLAAGAADKGLELVCDAHPDVPSRLRGDPVRLRQVLVNLLGNAIKFTEQGEVVASVTVENSEERVAAPPLVGGESVKLLFTVRDTGVGIPKDRLEEIFASFTQADGTITRKYGGTGLGLAVSRQIIELMGDKICVDSEEGCGSTFSFRASFETVSSAECSREPQASACAKPQRAGMSRVPAGALAGGHVSSEVEEGQFPDAHQALSGKRALVVDDNAASRQMLCRMFESWGCVLQSASGGATALDMLRAAGSQGDPFDLVVLDVQMPEVNGFQVRHAIRSDPSCGDPRVVFLGSLGGVCPTSTEAAETWLTKPIRRSEMFEALVKIFTTQPPAQAREGASRPQPPPNRRSFNMRILLVEDNAVNRQVATGLLRKCNHDVITAADGRAALDILEHKSFDLVLMDVQMPVMDGLEATQYIRASGRWPGLPVIAMTAHAMTGDRERCLQAGMDDYLTKPINLEGLRKMVEKWGPEQDTPREEIESPQDRRHPSQSSGTRNRDSRPQGSLDVEKVLEQLGGDRELFYEVLAVFLDNLPQLFGDLQSAASQADAARLHAAAHSLMGAASNMCAEPVRRVAQQLENMGRCGDLSDADSLIKELRGHLVRLQEFTAAVRDV